MAIARALSNEPSIILADEPTGNLDKKTGMEILELIMAVKSGERTIICVSHDEKILKKADRAIMMDELLM